MFDVLLQSARRRPVRRLFARRKLDRIRCSGNELCDWVGSLPFVVERLALGRDEKRVFAVHCEPLGRDAVFLVVTPSGAPHAPVTTTALVMPRGVARASAEAGLGMCSIPWPRGQVLFVADPDATEQSLEQLVSVAYCSALP
jgi:hypothetical protein